MFVLNWCSINKLHLTELNDQDALILILAGKPVAFCFTEESRFASQFWFVICQVVQIVHNLRRFYTILHVYRHIMKMMWLLKKTLLHIYFMS